MGFLEATCARAKTVTSLGKKSRFWLVVAPMESVTHINWVQTFVDLSEKCNSEVSENRKTCHCLQCPWFLASGAFSVP